MQNLSNIAIIPARAGSKGIKNKNLQKIGKSSLIARAINIAKKSKIFSSIILTTDIETAILDYQDDKNITIHRREPDLCDDVTNMDKVVESVIKHYNIKDSLVWLLQPSSPFRCVNDFKDIQSIFSRNKINSLISVHDVGAHHPNRMYTIVKENLKPIRFCSFKNKQELPKMYIRSGHFYVFKSDLFKKSFLIDPCYGYPVERERSLNIDEYFDLELAKLVYGAKIIGDDYV